MKLTGLQSHFEVEVEPEVFQSQVENLSSTVTAFELELPDGDEATIDFSRSLEGSRLASSRGFEGDILPYSLGSLNADCSGQVPAIFTLYKTV